MARLRMPIKARGTATLRWARWKEKQRQIVQRRAGYKCEACGSNMRPLELAHLVGRNNKGVGEPWASSAELTAALCSSGYGFTGCHDRIDRAISPDLQANLRWKALNALMDRYHSDLVPSSDDPLDVIRAAVQQLEEEGWGFDVERQEIVKA